MTSHNAAVQNNTGVTFSTDATTQAWGIALIAHGSRHQETEQVVDEVCRVMHESLHDQVVAVEPGFMELSERTIPDALERCYQAGARAIVLLPFFLVDGVHVLRDLPQEAAEWNTRRPDARVIVGKTLSAHPSLGLLFADLAKQALAHV